MERLVDEPGHLARVTCEILGPVPVDTLTVHAEVERPGRSVRLLSARIVHRGRDVLRARSWWIRHAQTGLSDPAGPPPPALPAAASELSDPRWRRGYLCAVEWRFVTGGFEQAGPARVWTRARLPLVAGEQLSPLQRTMLVADSGNGVSSSLDLGGWHFINPELTVHLHREPVGEWICLQAVSTVQPAGVGLAESALSDLTGPIGRGAQALLVGPR